MSDCIFCRIAAGEIPCEKIYEDPDMLAFRDITPQSPVHFLVIPKKHIKSLMETEKRDGPLLGKLLFKAGELAAEQGCQKGARFVLNCGSDGGQTVDHLHIHVLGGRMMMWPPG
ncbi:MAG: histidine triad nucleotide-binding protein [Treponema sp.]|jgi:histidine triad (HIT) family protein|nr:histidine triad nucleotide-binding protein [Treponema sp.]